MEMDIDGCGERKPTRQHCLGRITLINPSSIFFTDKNKKKNLPSSCRLLCSR